MNVWTLLPVGNWQHVLYAVMVGFAHSVALAVLVHLQCAKKKKAGQPADTKPAPAKTPKVEEKPAHSVDKEKTADATGHTDVDPDLKSKSDYNIKTEPEGPMSAMAPQQGDKFVAKGGGVFVDKDGNPISQHAQPNDIRN